ncbi:MAG: sigma-70 family RNA polymerase sigma factor [Chthoniobacterales bacterium]|jgi:RNA polymerase sigma-70 factor, ECF subfamily
MQSEEPPATAQPPDDEDVRLMQLSGAGDMRAFEQLVERHQNLVIGTIGRMLGNSSEVEDLAQQVFIRVWKNAGRYVARAKFTTWLLTITRNLVFNELRRRRRHNAVPLQVDDEGEERPIADEQTHEPDAALLERELDEAIRAAIAALPESQRMAVVLRRYEQLSYDEIAEVLGQTVPAVKSLLFRARTEMREKLSKYLNR